MKKKRGLSYDEKRDKMLKIFHDSVHIDSIRKQFSTMIRSKSYRSRLGFLSPMSRKF